MARTASHSFKTVGPGGRVPAHLGAMIALVCIACIPYLNTVSLGFAFDDKGLVTGNRMVVQGTTVSEVFSTNYRYGAGNPHDGLYRPLTMLTFVMNAPDHEPASWIFHLTNMLFNTIAVVLLAFLASRLTGSFVAGWVAAVFFACHPVHTEAVANVAGRPELLYTLFLLSAWLLAEKARTNHILLPVMAGCLFAGLLSKETAIMLPFMVIAVDAAKGRILNDKRSIALYGSMVATIALYLVIRWSVLGDTATGLVPFYFDNPLYHEPALIRIATACTVFLRCVGLLIFPWHLISDYSFNTIPLVDSFANLPALAGAFMLVSLAGIALWCMFRKKAPWVVLAVALLLGPYLLVSNIVFPVGTILGERLLYLPVAGLAVAIGVLTERCLSRSRGMTVTVLVVMIIAGSARAAIRNDNWRDDATLTRVDLMNAPDNVKLLANRAFELRRQGADAEAESLYIRAVGILPEFVPGFRGLGKMAFERGDLDEASRYYRQAATVGPDNADAQFDYASVLIQRGEFGAARSILEAATARMSDAPLPFRGMGNLLLAEKNYREAAAWFKRAGDLGDDQQVTLTNEAVAYFYAGDYLLAKTVTERAASLGISLPPDFLEELRVRLGR